MWRPKASCRTGSRALATLALLGGVVLAPASSEAAPPGGGCNEGVLAPASATLRDSATDALQSDDGAYVHCQDGQVSIGRQEGRFRIDTKKYNPSSRRMVVHLDGDSCTGGPCPDRDLTSHAIFQTHTRYECDDPDDPSTCEALPGTVLDLRTIPVGEVRYTRLIVYFYESNKESSLSFYNASEGVVEGGQACGGDPLKVTCVSGAGGSCSAWVMEGTNACYYRAAKPGRVFQGVYGAPLQLDVELVP